MYGNAAQLSGLSYTAPPHYAWGMSGDDNEPLTRESLDHLRSYIEAKRGRSREITAQLGIEPSSVSDWLNGRTVPSLENGLRIQRTLARHRVRRIRNEDIE
jgi:helix-turn-helix protein